MEMNQASKANLGKRNVQSADEDKSVADGTADEEMQFHPEASDDVTREADHMGTASTIQAGQQLQAMPADAPANEVEQIGDEPNDDEDTRLSDEQQSKNAGGTADVSDNSQWPYGRKLNDQEGNTHLE